MSRARAEDPHTGMSPIFHAKAAGLLLAARHAVQESVYSLVDRTTASGAGAAGQKVSRYSSTGGAPGSDVSTAFAASSPRAESLTRYCPGGRSTG